MDLLKTFGPLIGSIAPTLATALGGPLAGLAVKTLSNALLGHDGGSEADVMAALQGASPDQLAQIKKIDADFAVQMKSLDIDLARITVDDRKSARDMQMVTKSWLVPTLATMIIAAFIAVTFATLMGYAKIESALAGTLVGYISAKAELVLSFYFGSSAGSEKKDEMLYKSTPGA
jgi:energy-converting hydrogenase Eha subunit A